MAVISLTVRPTGTCYACNGSGKAPDLPADGPLGDACWNCYGHYEDKMQFNVAWDLDRPNIPYDDDKITDETARLIHGYIRKPPTWIESWQ